MGVVRALRAWQRVPVARLTAALAITAAYGVFDEWHQSFVPGRCASLIDVVLDVAGAAFGVWLATRFRSLGWANAWQIATVREWFLGLDGSPNPRSVNP